MPKNPLVVGPGYTPNPESDITKNPVNHSAPP
jgi:hypothetical protein